MTSDLTAKVVEFCALLRDEHGFSVGLDTTRDALRALETVGVRSRSRAGIALQIVCCSSPEQIDIFERVFADFFANAVTGVEQPQHAERRTRPDRRERRADSHEREKERPRERVPEDAADSLGSAPALVEPDAESVADAWQVMRARYSPASVESEPPSIPAEGLDQAMDEANRLVTSVRLGRSLRWKPRPHGSRFDLRRTLRASLRTGGDTAVMHMLGHPLRNPRFVLLIDGSRSMSEYGPRALQFALALCRRTRRSNAFLFSTGLREITRDLRDVQRGESWQLDDLGDAWGGGTRIGASLDEFVRAYGARLTDQTMVIIVSDGLDVGDIAQLEHAMREIKRRSATVAWVNPHAGDPGYSPTARGMQVALPYIDKLVSFEEIDRLRR